MTNVALHQHSEFSFLDGEAKTEKLARRAANSGADASALTDHGDCGGAVQWQKVCQKNGIKPVFGMEGYFYDKPAREAKPDKVQASAYSHITVLAKNNDGLRDLWTWTSRAWVDHFYRKPIVSWDDMRELGRHVYASDGCLLSYMAKAIIADDEQRQHELMARYLDTFGDNFYMELHTWQFVDPTNPEQHNLNADMSKVNQAKVELARQYGVPLVVVNDNHYADPEDWERHALVWRMNAKGNTDQTPPGRTAAWQMVDDELIYWMRRHGISDDVTREAIKNSQIIADNCNAEIVPQVRLPRITETDEADLRLFLRNLEEGFERKVIGKGKDAEIYRARLEHETKVIVDAHFSGYFNVVTDYLRWAKHEAKMFIGPGRGSAGGSLAAYLLDITEMDPLKYDLLFERFLSDGRKGFPDIDSDFPQSRLGEAKEYMARRYGADHVCGIGTVSASGPKAIVKDLGRAMRLPKGVPDEISKAIGKTKPDESWDAVMVRRAAQLQPWQTRYPELFARGSEMAQMVRHWGKHASGFIASPDPLMGLLPLRKKPDEDGIVTQWDHREVEWFGLVKQDFLGLRHCDTIAETMRICTERGKEFPHPYDFDDAQYADPAIWESVAKGDTLGLFQLNADLMTDTAREFKPQSEVEVGELLAVNRPGVLKVGLDKVYIARKHGREPVIFDHPFLEDITGETYGILIFQEQLMKMSQMVAGFTPQEADNLRSVVGKKKIDQLPALREQFYRGARANREFLDLCPGDPEKVIEKLWSSIQASGEYLFNKSHSLAYALIASWEAWFKHYFYEEFITACMISDRENIPEYVRHARGRGLDLLPPDINASGTDFTLTPEGIRYGLTAVSHCGDKAVREITRKRPFKSLRDMLERVTKADVNKTVTLHLIRIGAFDSLNPNRRQLEFEYYQHAKIREKDWLHPLPDYKDLLSGYRLEKSLIGSHILYDPLRPYEKLLAAKCLDDPEKLDALQMGDIALVGGLITKVKEIRTKKGTGDPMCFMTLTYLEQDFEVTVFPEAYATHRVFIEEDAPVVCRVIRIAKGVHLTALQRLDYLDD